jgi:uncharacterized Zn-binding protein involved in type VI secretion
VSWANTQLALQQKLDGVTGDQHSSLDRAGNTFGEVGGVYTRWHESWQQATAPLPPPPTNPDGTPRPMTTAEKAQRAAAQVRRVNSIVGAAMGALNMGQDMLNVGFSNLTAPLAAISPSLPSATITTMYIGTPHGHTHPPSLIPPAPMVPLPSLGPITLGTCVRVLIGGMPAARAGDLGLAPTCCGFAPFFQVVTGSSNVYIGGTRAARLGDICRACVKGEDRTIDAGKIMSMIGKMADYASKGLAVAGVLASAGGMLADAAEAAVEDDAAMASAKTLAVAMAAAAKAADAAAMALSKTMGTDPGVAPSTGALLLGHPTVLIGGFPMVNIPNPINYILDKLKRFKPKPPTPPEHADEQSGCKTCGGGK